MTTQDGGRGDVAVLVPAAGAGVRLGPGAPKALRLLAGEPLLVHAVRRLAAAPSVGCLVVAAPPDQEGVVHELVAGALDPHRHPDVVVVTGGGQRQQSVAAALAAVPDGFDLVLVHDAARALAPPSLVEDVAAALRHGHDAVIPVLPLTDSVVQVDQAGGMERALERSTLRAVQTPQGFRRGALVGAHAAAPDTSATDDAGLVARLGRRVHTIPGATSAMKITAQTDLVLAAALLADPQLVR